MDFDNLLVHGFHNPAYEKLGTNKCPQGLPDITRMMPDISPKHSKYHSSEHKHACQGSWKSSEYIIFIEFVT